jgi:hypothetical protein
MTAAVHRTGTPSLSVPPTQNTAPVLEFNCLYTHDIRRKQKRWQDGFLRFHTFNKRVMVYDVPRNFIGDMHWKEDTAFDEGEEFTLERDAVLVQVAESVGRTETDLTELKQSAKKSRREGGGQRSSPPPMSLATPSRAMGPPMARPGTASVAGGNTQLKHRSLNALLGTPKGRIGKAAVPTKSPFEMRQTEENEEWESGRPSKRSKPEAWNVTRTTTVASPAARKETPLWKRTSEARAKAAKQTPLPRGQQKLGTKEVIDLSDDGEDSPSRFLPGFSSDAIGPASSPVREIPRPAPVARKQQVRSSSPVFQTQQVTTTKRNGKEPVIQRSPRPERIPHVETPTKAPELPERLPSPEPLAPPLLPPPPTASKASQTLRMATSAPKRRTLACLDQISAPPGEGSNRPRMIESERPTTLKRKTQRELLEERLEKMNKMAQQRADDLNDIVDDADATALEIDQMDQAAMTPPSTDPRSERPTADKPDRPFRRVVSETGTTNSTATSVKRIPGAPVRFTPPPTTRAARPADSAKQRSPRIPVLEEREQQPPAKTTELMGPPPAPLVTPAPVHAKPDPPMARSKSPPPPEALPPKPAKSRPGIGRKEVRKSAQACFPTALNVAANGTSTVMLAKPFQAPRPPAKSKPPPTSSDVGPWSRDAFDLFTWRPPGWDEEKWCVSKDNGGVVP